jgi:hypothetical protein
VRKLFFLIMILGSILNGCLPASFTSNPASPAPISDQDLQATASVLSQQTLQALPSPTISPSNTPVIIMESNTNTPSETATATETPSPDIGAFPSPTGNVSIIPLPSITVTNTVSVPPTTSTPQRQLTATSTETLHPRFYGTLPPNLPSGKITLVNRSKKEVYVSLQCTTQAGFVTIIEYPVPSTVKTNAPAGKYIYVVWVGGNKLTGSFGLGIRDDLVITIYKDRIGIK